MGRVAVLHGVDTQAALRHLSALRSVLWAGVTMAWSVAIRLIPGGSTP